MNDAGRTPTVSLPENDYPSININEILNAKKIDLLPFIFQIAILPVKEQVMAYSYGVCSATWVNRMEKVVKPVAESNG